MPPKTVFSGAVLLAAALLGQDLPRAPKVLWQFADSNGLRPQAAVDGLLYLGGEQLRAFELRTGQVVHACARGGVWTPPVVHGDRVLTRHEDGSWVAWSRSLDRQLWRAPLPGSPWHAPTVDGDVAVVAAGTELVALALADGAVRWRTDLGDTVEMTPATDGERAFAGSRAGVVVAIDLQSGEERWRHDLGAECGFSDPVVDRKMLFLADRGRGNSADPADRGRKVDEIEGPRAGALHAFDAATGAHLWGRVFGATGCSRPFPTGNDVYAGFGRVVARFARGDGAVDFDRAIRTGSNAFGTPGVVGDAIAFGNLDGRFYVHDLATGSLRWAFAPGAGGAKVQVGAWLLHQGWLCVHTTKGVYVLAQDPDAGPVPSGFVLRAH